VECRRSVYPSAARPRTTDTIWAPDELSATALDGTDGAGGPSLPPSPCSPSLPPPFPHTRAPLLTKSLIRTGQESIKFPPFFCVPGSHTPGIVVPGIGDGMDDGWITDL